MVELNETKRYETIEYIGLQGIKIEVNLPWGWAAHPPSPIDQYIETLNV